VERAGNIRLWNGLPKRLERSISIGVSLLPGGKRVLVVLFVPSVERDGKTMIDQNKWVELALEMLGSVFGGATAYPKARGVWRDDERGGALVFDEPVVIQCYTVPEAIEDEANLAKVGGFCRTMGKETNQGEIGLVIADEYFAIRNYEEPVP
jgi:hypothetical protein